MRKLLFKKFLVGAIVLILTATFFIPASSESIKLNNETVAISVNQSGDIIQIRYEINDFVEESVKINGNDYSVIKIGRESNLLLEGKPDIPWICRSILIPDTAKMNINIVSSSYEVYDNVLIAPSKGNILRTVNPDDVPYVFDEIYNINAWFPSEIASLREPYILRDYRGQVVEIYPIQYNPVTKQMRFYYDIIVEVYPNGIDNINTIYREELPEKVDADFKSIYQNHFINFNLGRYTPVEEQGNMLIITYDAFWDAMVPFYEWKNYRGIPTEMVSVSTIGNANAIKDYIAQYYNTKGLTFVLLVGDAAQVPPYMYGGSASDPSNTYVVGSDHYPDLFIGRFSAENVDQVTTQVERSVEYERDPQIDAEWYHKGVGIASSQGPGDDGEYDYQHIRNIRTQLLAYTYTYVDELYDGSQGGDDAPGNPTPAMVAVAVDNGRSIINYCGHGSTTSWGSSGFSNSNVNNLVNDNMLPFVHSVACVNGAFPSTTCFAEAWMRATNNGEPTGAIGAFMSTISQSWNPPMEGQDEFNNLLVQSYTDNIKVTLGGLTAHGCMSMNDKYGSSGTSETDYWTLFGDPSLQIRTDVPSEMTIAHDTNIDIQTWSLGVTVTGIKGALCALSRNNELFGSAYTDENGYALIQLDEPVVGQEPLDLVVTAYNKIPYTAEILINSAPTVPEKPNGPSKVKINTEYLFTTTSTDLDDDLIYYRWWWGDGNLSDWLGPYRSEEIASATHSWTEKKFYQVKVQAMDTFGQQTDWSEPLEVEGVRSRSVQFNLISRLLELYPNAFAILKAIFRLIVN